MRVRIRRFDRLVPARARAGWAFAVWGRRVGFTSRVSIHCGFTAPCLPKACQSRMASAIPSSRPKHYLTLPIVRAFAARATTTPSADFCCAFRTPRGALSHDSVTHSRSPVISSTAFHARPPDLPPVPLMDMGFAIICSLAPHRRPLHPVLVHRPAPPRDDALARRYHFTSIRL